MLRGSCVNLGTSYILYFYHTYACLAPIIYMQSHTIHYSTQGQCNLLLHPILPPLSSWEWAYIIKYTHPRSSNLFPTSYSLFPKYTPPHASIFSLHTGLLTSLLILFVTTHLHPHSHHLLQKKVTMSTVTGIWMGRGTGQESWEHRKKHDFPLSLR